MKVCLINSHGGVYAGSYPIGLAIIASYLRKHDHEVMIIDRASGDSITKINFFKPDIVGITATTPTVSDAYKVASYCKEKGYKVVMGGPHPSVMPNEALEHCDCVVIGEGEQALLKILREDLTGVVVGTPIMDLDEIPMPAYDLLNMEFYIGKKGEKLLTFSDNSRLGFMLSSRGCPYKCTFCHNSFKGIKYRSNSAKRIVDEIEYLIENYEIDCLFFIEDNFFVNKKRVKEICELMIERKVNISWGANSRVDNMDKEIMKLAKKSGCIQMTFGWESGSQRILDIYNKGTTIEQNVESVRLCNEVGIFPNGTLMIGAPNETIEDMRLSRQFVLDNDIKGGAAFCITTPFPGTQMWDEALRKGKIKPNNIKWNDFDFSRVPVLLTEFNEKQLFEICEKLRGITGIQRGSNMNRLQMESIKI